MVESCDAARLLSGSVTIGRETVPIVNPVTMQMGFFENEETGAPTVVDPVPGRRRRSPEGCTA